MEDYSKWKMSDLRAEFPTIKATNKRDFLRKVKIEVENRSELGSSIGETGTVNVTLTAKKSSTPPLPPTEEEEKPDANPYPEVEGNSRRKNTKQQRSAEGKPMVSYDKGKSGTHPHEGIDVQGKDGDKTNSAKEISKELLENELVQRYLLSSDDLLAVTKVGEDEAVIVVGDKKSNYYKALWLRKNKATKTIKSSRETNFKGFVGSVS